MKIRAKFKGDKPRKGFRPGCQYSLNFDTGSIFKRGKYRDSIEVSKWNEFDKDTDLSYSSLKKFLKSWDIMM
jgi:hypothetical protein